MYFFYYVPVGINRELRKFPFMTYFFSFLCLAVFVLNRFFSDSLPVDFYNFIYFPDRSGVISSIAAAFLHFGYLHIISNLLYLIVFGRYIEDRLGPALFTLLFLSSSAIGNLSQGAFNIHVLHQGYVGIIGASGSVSGILGAFIIRFYASRLQVAYWTFMPLQAYTKAGKAEIPAVLAVSLWFVLQVIQGLVQAGGFSTGVAYVTHIMGFMGGMALMIALGGHREASVEQTWYRAERYLKNGDAYAAQGELLHYLATEKDDDRGYVALARALLLTGDQAGALVNYQKACELLLANKQRGKAENLFREALYGFPDFVLPPPKQLDLAFGLERSLKPDLALKAYQNFEETYPCHKEAAFALLRSANLHCSSFEDRRQALCCYQKLISRHPDDEWADFAREQIRILSFGGAAV
ncbi:MAG: rhomboid family intramembrane serine protease [Candidatus Latescibacterota bacterium]